MLGMYGDQAGREFEIEATRQPMDAFAGTALPRALFSADLHALKARAVGLSVLLLVSVCVGHRRFCANGDRLPQAEDLIF